MLYCALLRAVNVGGRRLPMADLRDLATGLGLTDVTTLLQSGNLVFRSPRRSSDALAHQLEDASEARFGFRSEYFVRNSSEWQAIVEGNPFAREARDDPGHLHVLLFSKRIAAAQEAALRAAIRGREYLHFAGTHAYAVYPDGVGESKLTSALIESRLGCRTTGRNWNTTLKLLALLG